MKQNTKYLFSRKPLCSFRFSYCNFLRYSIQFVLLGRIHEVHRLNQTAFCLDVLCNLSIHYSTCFITPCYHHPFSMRVSRQYHFRINYLMAFSGTKIDAMLIHKYSGIDIFGCRYILTCIRDLTSVQLG